MTGGDEPPPSRPRAAFSGVRGRLFALATATAAGVRSLQPARVPQQLPLLATRLTLPHDEIADLARVAEWLGASPATRMPAEKLVEEIRRNREGFAVFAGFHTEQERRQALVDTPFGVDIANAAREHDVDSLLVASVVEVSSSGRVALMRARAPSTMQASLKTASTR